MVVCCESPSRLSLVVKYDDNWRVSIATWTIRNASWGTTRSFSYLDWLPRSFHANICITNVICANMLCKAQGRIWMCWHTACLSQHGIRNSSSQPSGTIISIPLRCNAGTTWLLKPPGPRTQTWWADGELGMLGLGWKRTTNVAVRFASDVVVWRDPFLDFKHNFCSFICTFRFEVIPLSFGRLVHNNLTR